MPSKIEKQLTPEQVVELLETLVRTPGGQVLRVIQAEAAKRGIEISPMGATSFRDGALHPYIAKLKAARQKSEMLAEAVTAGDESGLLAAARTGLAEQVVDFILTEEPNAKGFGGLAKTLSMLSSSNQGDRLLAVRLSEYEARDAERKAAAAKLEAKKTRLVKKGGLSDEAIGLMEEAIGLSS